MTDLRSRIRKQVEFYFSDSNVSMDSFMQKQISTAPDGFVPISTLMTFKKLKALTDDAALVADACSSDTSGVVEVSADRRSIRRKHPLPESDLTMKRAVHVRGLMLPPEIAASGDDAIRNEIERMFSSHFGPVISVRLRRYPDKSFSGAAYVEFPSPDIAERVCNEAHNVLSNGGDLEVLMKWQQKQWLDAHAITKAERKAAAPPFVSPPHTPGSIIWMKGVAPETPLAQVADTVLQSLLPSMVPDPAARAKLRILHMDGNAATKTLHIHLNQPIPVSGFVPADEKARSAGEQPPASASARASAEGKQTDPETDGRSSHLQADKCAGSVAEESSKFSNFATAVTNGTLPMSGSIALVNAPAHPTVEWRILLGEEDEKYWTMFLRMAETRHVAMHMRRRPMRGGHFDRAGFRGRGAPRGGGAGFGRGRGRGGPMRGGGRGHFEERDRGGPRLGFGMRERGRGIRPDMRGGPSRGGPRGGYGPRPYAHGPPVPMRGGLGAMGAAPPRPDMRYQQPPPRDWAQPGMPQRGPPHGPLPYQGLPADRFGDRGMGPHQQPQHPNQHQQSLPPPYHSSAHMPGPHHPHLPPPAYPYDRMQPGMIGGGRGFVPTPPLLVAREDGGMYPGTGAGSRHLSGPPHAPPHGYFYPAEPHEPHYGGPMGPVHGPPAGNRGYGPPPPGPGPYQGPYQVPGDWPHGHPQYPRPIQDMRDPRNEYNKRSRDVIGPLGGPPPPPGFHKMARY